MVYLMRHLRPEVAAGVCYGRLDLPPEPGSSVQIAQALAVVPPLHAILSSPAQRCRQLADALAARDDLDLEVDERLLELDFGAWEGRRWDDLPRAEIDAWADDVWSTVAGGGESMAALWQRVAQCREARLLDGWRGSERRLLIVAHHGSLRALWSQFLGQRPEEFFAATFDYAAAGFRAVPVNATDHATLEHE